MSFQLPPKFDQGKFMTDIQIDRNNLSENMAQHSALGAYYGIQHALWEGTLNRLKMRTETMRSVRELEIRSELETEHGKKPTEGMVKSSLLADDKMENFRKLVVEAEEQALLYKNAVEFFKHRREHLTSLGHDARQERQGELSIRELEARHGGGANSRELADKAKSMLAGRSEAGKAEAH